MTSTPSKATAGPWEIDDKEPGELWISGNGRCHPVCMVTASGNVSARDRADAALISAAPELLEAAMLLETAEEAHANCDECGGDEAPECCAKCFPLFDDARVKRRAAISRATGEA